MEKVIEIDAFFGHVHGRKVYLFVFFFLIQDLVVEIRLLSSSWQSSCLSFLGAGIADIAIMLSLLSSLVTGQKSVAFDSPHTS